MVLKKPYAFLIKHFKLIHLILCIPLVYLIIKTGAITSFFSTYVQADYYTSLVNIPGVFINYFMYFAVLIIILISLAVYFLMRQKEKDTKFYMFLIIYYIFLFVMITFCHSILGSIETASISAQTIRVYRDVAYIIYVPQFFFTGYSLLRGIGFDIKKFNFQEDAKELEITDIDSEEFELVFGEDAYKYKRTIRRFIREFRYYVLENKFAFSILASIIIIIMGTLLYLNYGVYNRRYKETQRISHNNLIISVEDSILTNLGVGGKVIDKDKYYMAISFKIKNNGKESVSLDYDNFKLEVADRMLSTTLDRATYFPDLGIAYTRDTSFSPGEEGTYVLTYEIDSSFLNQNIVLKILDSMTFEIGSVTPIYKTVQLNYEKILENKEERTVDYGKILELSSTRLGLSQIQLNEYAFHSSYEYQFERCSINNCQTLTNKVIVDSDQILLVIDRKFMIDRYTNYYIARKGMNSFVNDFITIRYNLSGTVTSNVRDVTPNEVENLWIFEVPRGAKDASKIDILITYRGHVYTMKLK